MTDRVYQCDCEPGSVAVRVCHGDKPVCWANGNGSPPDPRVTLTRLLDLAAKATPGPWNNEAHEHTLRGCRCGQCIGVTMWEVGPSVSCRGREDPFEGALHNDDCADSGYSFDDAEFIAESRSAVPVLAAALQAVLQLTDEAIEQNRPPNATNSEVIWFAGDIRAAVADALVGLNPTGEALKLDPGNLNDGGSDSSFANPTEETQ